MNYLTQFLDTRLLMTLILSGTFAGLVITLKTLPMQLFHYLKRQLITTIMVESTCEAYHLLNDWIEQQPFAQATRSMLLENAKASDRWITTSSEDAYAARRKTLASWRISLGQGTYLFVRNGVFFIYRKTSKQPAGGLKEVVHTSELTALTRDKCKVLEILEKCHGMLVEDDSVKVYDYSGKNWTLVDRRKPRSLSTLILNKGQLERIVADIEWHYEAENWYLQRGIPYRRGYLFSGPPGTGKTSTIVALATHFQKNIYLLNLNALSSDRELAAAISEVPKGSYIALEDVDCVQATSARTTTPSAKNEKGSMGSEIIGVTMGGLLNALDGIATPEGRMYFLTTNHPLKLDAAMLRAGRVDVHEVIDLLPKDRQEVMAELFYGADAFVGLEQFVSPANLQRAFMQHPTEPLKARELLLIKNAAVMSQ